MYRKMIGSNLQKILDEKKISYTSLSKITGISRDHIYHIVNGTKELGIDTFEKICLSLSVDPACFFEPINFEESDKLIVEYFRSLGPECWNFKDADTSFLIHGLHSYPAVMIWPISNLILNGVKQFKEITSMLDPFVGSGTVAVEGQRNFVPKVYANDLNPLALLITKAKTTLLNDSDIQSINKIKNLVLSTAKESIDLITEFKNYASSQFDLVNKGDWSNFADKITNDYFKSSILEKHHVKSFSNIGFWFRPECVIEIQIIKDLIDSNCTKNNKSFLLCTLSEVIRSVSNTRSGEFKLYRKPENVILSKEHNVFDLFIKKLNTNLQKEESYIKNVKQNSELIYLNENAQDIKEIDDNSIDIVITSPPYGDSHTTVAYGQFSRLSNLWLGLAEDNIDNILLGGTKNKIRNIDSLGSTTLIDIYNQISVIDQKRANEVLDFYIDLDKTIKEITRTVKVGGYEFWVVGNRTVKLVNIPTDVIIDELGRKYGLKCLDKYYRYISNKVMPSINSPTNVAGNHAKTMSSEVILFLKKEN